MPRELPIHQPKVTLLAETDVCLSIGAGAEPAANPFIAHINYDPNLSRAGSVLRARIPHIPPPQSMFLFKHRGISVFKAPSPTPKPRSAHSWDV
jgi:hypothetical protein